MPSPQYNDGISQARVNCAQKENELNFDPDSSECCHIRLCLFDFRLLTESKCTGQDLKGLCTAVRILLKAG